MLANKYDNQTNFQVRNTSNWKIMADLNLETAVDRKKYKRYV